MPESPAPATTPFHYCSRCGHADLILHGHREFVCADCGFRHFITPIPAACVLIVDEANRLLLARRSHEPGFGKLGLPGGVIEPGETGEQAAVREVFEEVGLTLPVDGMRYLGAGNNGYLFQDFYWPTLDLFFVAEVTAFGTPNPDPAEVSEVQFVPLDEVNLDELAFGTHGTAVELLRKARALRPAL